MPDNPDHLTTVLNSDPDAVPAAEYWAAWDRLHEQNLRDGKSVCEMTPPVAVVDEILAGIRSGGAS